jgi:hypothetical protein
VIAVLVFLTRGEVAQLTAGGPAVLAANERGGRRAEMD